MIALPPAAAVVHHKSAEIRPAAGRMNCRDTVPSLTSLTLPQSRWTHLRCIKQHFTGGKHASMRGQLGMPIHARVLRSVCES